MLRLLGGFTCALHSALVQVPNREPRANVDLAHEVSTHNLAAGIIGGVNGIGTQKAD